MSFSPRRDFGCRRDLHWRADLPDETRALASDTGPSSGVPHFHVWVVSLATLGWIETDRGSEILRTFEHTEGHVLVVSPRSRKLRIRIDPMTLESARAERVHALCDELRALWGNKG